jgi:hypothetical protein
MLTDEQVERFYTLGYCVTRVGLDEEIVQRAIDTVWAHCPSSFRQDSPRTWKGEFTDSCHTMSIKDRRGRVKLRECLRGERWLYDLTAAHPGILAAVSELIGDPVAPEYVRGLYPVFPSKPRPIEGHCDQHKFQVGVVLYLSDVAPGGGGFTIWPGSHHVVAKHHGSLGGKDRLPTFDSAVAEVQAATQPVELAGPSGTVVFWHQRIVHTAGINTSKTVRHATLCDFKNERFLSAADCPAADPWETWSPRVRQLASVREEVSAG